MRGLAASAVRTELLRAGRRATSHPQRPCQCAARSRTTAQPPLIDAPCCAALRLLRQVRRPNNYDVNLALMLGPTEPNPTMDLSALEIVRTVVQVGRREAGPGRRQAAAGGWGGGALQRVARPARLVSAPSAVWVARLAGQHAGGACAPLCAAAHMVVVALGECWGSEAARQVGHSVGQLGGGAAGGLCARCAC